MSKNDSHFYQKIILICESLFLYVPIEEKTNVCNVLKGNKKFAHITELGLEDNISLNMKPMKKHRSDQGSIILAGLPEQVLRQIFRYIGTYKLFHTVRKLNQRLKKLVDEYLCLRGVFMLIRGQNNRYIYI